MILIYYPILPCITLHDVFKSQHHQFNVNYDVHFSSPKPHFEQYLYGYSECLSGFCFFKLQRVTRPEIWISFPGFFSITFYDSCFKGLKKVQINFRFSPSLLMNTVILVIITRQWFRQHARQTCHH